MNLFIKQTRVVEVPVTTLHVCQNIMAMTTMLDVDGTVCGHAIFPTWIPQVLEIDLATGQIKNWCVPTGEQLQAIADAKADTRFDGFGVNQNRVSKEFSPELTNALRLIRGDRSEPTLGSTCAPPQVVESAAHTVANAAYCAPADQQSKPLEIDGIKTPDHGWVAGLLVSVSEKAGKWSATTGQHTATSTQGKFEAINGALNKAGMGRCEINQQKDENGHPIDGMYLADDSRTKGLTPVYVSGHEIGKGHTARTSSGKKYTAPTEAEALDGLLREVLKVEVPDDAIVDTTDDEMVFNDKQRFIIDMSKAVAIVEPEPTSADIEDEPQPICQPARARYRNPDDHSQTWTGRGKPPEWLQAKLDAGDQLTDYAISDSAA